MNPTESWYYEHILKPRLLSTAVNRLEKVEFERIKVILVHPDSGTKRREAVYCPDFYCLRADGETEIHEVKGFADEADRLKIKKSAEMFPEWHWIMAHVGGGKLKKKVVKVEEF